VQTKMTHTLEWTVGGKVKSIETLELTKLNNSVPVGLALRNNYFFYGWLAKKNLGKFDESHSFFLFNKN